MTTTISRGLDVELALRAIAHPGRRRALEMIAEGDRSSGDIAAGCRWSKPAASQHLKILRTARLVEVRVHGNRRLYRVRRDSVDSLRRFLDEFWSNRLGTLATHIDERERARTPLPKRSRR